MYKCIEIETVADDNIVWRGFVDIRIYNPRQKSLARLDQITETCVDKLFWKQQLMASLE